MDQLALGSITACFGKAGLAAGTTTTITIANTLDFSIKGKLYRKTAVSNAASPTTDRQTAAAFIALAASRACVFAVCLDSDGTIRVYQGPTVTLAADDSYVTAPEFPGIKDTDCMIGYIVAKNLAAGSSWTFSSSNWTATGLTDTFVDVSTVPDRPQTS